MTAPGGRPNVQHPEGSQRWPTSWPTRARTRNDRRTPPRSPPRSGHLRRHRGGREEDTGNNGSVVAARLHYVLLGACSGRSCASRSKSPPPDRASRRFMSFFAITEDGLTSSSIASENRGRSFPHARRRRSHRGTSWFPGGESFPRRRTAAGPKGLGPEWSQSRRVAAGGKLSPDLRSRDHVDNDRGRIEALRARRQLVLPPLLFCAIPRRAGQNCVYKAAAPRGIS